MRRLRYEMMPAPFRNLFLLLAVLSVGTLQVVGVPMGYLCACTGETSAQVDCEKIVCHPEATHMDGCATDTEGCGDSEPGHGDPARDGHEHNQVRDDLSVTGFPSPVALPALVMYVLPQAFQEAEFSVLVIPKRGREGSGYPDDGSPPTPLLVARTMVMLV